MPSVDEEFEHALDCHRSGRLAEAEKSYRRILERDPEHADALHLLGVVALQTGNPEPALALIRRAIELRPDGAVYYNNLGLALDRLGRTAEAERAYEDAIALDPNYAEAFNNLGQALERQNRLAEAEARYRRATELSPGYAEPCNNLGNLLKDRGELDPAIACYRRAIALRPDMSLLHSNLLLTLHYHPDYSPADLAAEHRIWAERHIAPLRPARRPLPNAPEPERRLRIGYVSPDFREHAVMRFIRPILEHHDHRNFAIVGYSDTPRRDEITDATRAQVDEWRDIAALGDTDVDAVIRQDRIDILVDLAAHSGRNRLLVFGRKPAPVQVTYLAYCSTTGVDAIDYRLSDRFLDPPGTDLSNYTERTIRLPGCYWCYSAPPLPPGRRPSTDRRPGPPTFGCLNNFAKITEPTLELWAELMRRVPDARLLLYARAERHRDRVLRFWRRAGLAESRLAFVGWQPLAEYLDTYREIDVGLDPRPFGGGTTTCDSLWMGVPVVSLTGSTAVSRAGASLLSNAGLGHLVVDSTAAYVDLAARLLDDTDELVRLRRTLRAQLEASPVMDAATFTHGLETVYRDVWRSWCATR